MWAKAFTASVPIKRSGYAFVSAKTHAVIKGKSGTHVLYALQTLNEDKCFV